MSNFTQNVSRPSEEVLLILPVAVILQDKELPHFVKTLCQELMKKTYLSLGEWLSKADFYSLYSVRDSFELFTERTNLIASIASANSLSEEGLSVEEIASAAASTLETALVKHNPEIRFVLSAYLTSLFLQGEGCSGLATAKFVRNAHLNLNSLIAAEILKRKHFDITLDYSKCSLLGTSSKDSQDLELNGVIVRGEKFEEQMRKGLRSLQPTSPKEVSKKGFFYSIFQKLRFWNKN